MADVSFEWDARKNRANQKKHGVSFEEARTAFFDEHARVIADPEHSDDEDRAPGFERPTACLGRMPLLQGVGPGCANHLGSSRGSFRATSVR